MTNNNFAFSRDFGRHFLLRVGAIYVAAISIQGVLFPNLREKMARPMLPMMYACRNQILFDGDFARPGVWHGGRLAYVIDAIRVPASSY